MSTGADNKSLPGTNEFRDNYDKIFGKREVQRGKFVFDEAQQKFVPAEHYQPPEQAKNAPIMSGRFYENTSALSVDERGNPVQVDIGSRSKHAEHMRRNGLTVQSDFKETWKGKAKDRAEFFKEGGNAQERAKRRDTIGRAAYEVLDKGKKP